ncbi:SGNH/GDSL hydrolase family protein [Shimia sp.]|uniref:SGNH/GDSL hydrolase family protein n=1 Tax=Shimia sp. TaxID=1954381 RepID=UPI003299E5E7
MWPPPDILARAPLAPLLALQGLNVRRRTQLLPEPPGPRQGQAGTGPPLRLLITGDSSAAGVGAPTQDTALSGQLVAELAQDFHVDWRLEAKTGDATRDTLRRLRTIGPRRFDIVVSALGVNDVTRARSACRWSRDQSELLDLVTTQFQARGLIASGLPPMGQYPMLPQPLRWVLGSHAIRLDKTLATFADQRPELTHVALDIPFEPRFMASDGYHPNPEAYRLWARLLATPIRAAMLAP